MTTKRIKYVLFLSAFALAGSFKTASASTLAIVGGTQTDFFEAETGGSMPAGTAGFLNGTLIATATGNYTFTFGGGGLLAGDTGHGNSPLYNAFWVGDRTAASSAGDIFCTQAITGLCSASAVGNSFTLAFTAGSTIPFSFSFGTTNSLSNPVLHNGDYTPAVAAILMQIGLGSTANAGPGWVAYVGLADSPYPADHDFQDLVVTVSSVPEPAPLALASVGLGLAVLIFGRRKSALALQAVR